MKIRIVKNLDEKKKRKKRRKKRKPRAAYWWGYGLHDSDYGDAGDGGGGDGKRDDELSEVYSEKQRRFFCASDDPELKAMCDDPMKEEQLDEKKKKKKRKKKRKVKKKKKGKKDACYRKVKSRYKVWPSAYASGALVKCRKVGASNWGNKSKKKNESMENLEMQLTTEQLEKMIAEEISLTLEEIESLEEKKKKKKKKKKPCKKAKGKRYVKRVNGRCRSFGQAGKAKGGGDRIRPGTKKGDAYCARSAKIKKCKNPPCANDLSRKKWKCRGSKSMRENNTDNE